MSNDAGLTAARRVPWWQHRGKVVAVGLVIVVLVSAIGFTIGGWWVMRGLRGSAPYGAVVEVLQSQDEMRRWLGEGIEPGYFVMGEIDETAGVADLMFEAEGSRGSAGVRARVERVDGVWRVTYLDLGLGEAEAGQTVTVIGDPASPPAPR